MALPRRVLFLAPQPFFQERGTPIAVRLALRVMAARQKEQVDLLTYHEGDDVPLAGVRVFRIWSLPGLSGIGPGLSLKKLICDLLFAAKTLQLVLRSYREGNPYRLIHAVEESVFFALLCRWIFGIPYLYDMDSSLALQVTEKWTVLKPVFPVLEWFERLAVRGSIGVVPVCDALAVIARRHGATHTDMLYDVSLLPDGGSEGAEPSGVNLRDEAKVQPGELVLLYIGNLERYQGIELLIRSFASVSQQQAAAVLVIVGGRDEHIRQYQALAQECGCGARVRFLGPRPVSQLHGYLMQADVLLSPRTLGNNTPMKIYSYLHSGRPVVATDLPTHTQVMDSEIALLAPPTVEGYSAALREIVASAELRERIGRKARARAEERYTFATFERALNGIYDSLDARLVE